MDDIPVRVTLETPECNKTHPVRAESRITEEGEAAPGKRVGAFIGSEALREDSI